MAFFFAARAARKRRVIPGEDRLQQAVIARVRREQAARAELDEIEHRAALHAYERSLE